MKEWFVYFRRFGDDVTEDERVVHFTSFRKLRRWLRLNLRDCYGMSIRCMIEGRLGGYSGW
jgi:hypothetical protein